MTSTEKLAKSQVKALTAGLKPGFTFIRSPAVPSSGNVPSTLQLRTYPCRVKCRESELRVTRNGP